MVSYTDGELAERWQQLSSDQLERTVLRALRSAFPQRRIPPPDALHRFFWPDGVHCFRPREGPTTDQELVRRWEEPFPGLHLAGEAFSMQHQWIEGALESGQRLARRLARRHRHKLV